MSLSRVTIFAVASILVSANALRPSAERQNPAQAPEQKKEPVKEEPLPLRADGKIEFTTDEGSWLSLDVSPDGSSIVFELLGDIYTVPFAGGAAVNIARGMAFDSQPKYSPNGKSIVFISDRSGAENLWLMDPDGGNPKALTRGTRAKFASPAWTPDGNYVIASRSAGTAVNALWLYHKDGGSGVEMVRSMPAGAPAGTAPRSSLGAVVSPDGRWVFFAQRERLFSYNVTSAPYQVYRFDRETGETTRVTGAQGGGMRPMLTPDGKHLIYATRFDNKTGYRIREMETGDERWLLYPVTRDDHESAATRDTMPGAAFTPDGKELVTTIGGRIVRIDLASGKTTPIPFEAKVEQEIGPRVYFETRVEEGPVKARLIRWAQQSPDGRRLAFSALSRLYVMDLPYGQPKRLTTNTIGEFAPVWSPDGRWIAFVTWAPEGGQIWKVPAEGGTPQQLSRRRAFYSDLAWTPDGERLVVVSGVARERLEGESGEGQQLRWLPASGGDTTLIAPMSGRSPHFARASDRVYLWSGGAITSMRFDGTDRKTHVRITGPSTGGPTPPSATDARISPDGQSAIADVQNKLYLVTIPKVGGDAPTVSVTDSSSMPVKRLTIDGGEYLNWTFDGRSVTWSLGATFYRQGVTADKAESFTATIEFPRARPEGTVLLRGAKAITMRGPRNDEVIEKSDILVTNNRIVEVGVQGRVKFPAGTRIIDVSGKTIIPGFVDVHAHLRRPAGVHQTQVWSFLANLAYGVTTTRDPQTGSNDTFAYEDMVDTGEILGPRVYSTGPGIFSASGLDDLNATRAFVKRYKEVYHTNTVKQYMVGDRKVRQWVIMACKEFGLTPTIEGGLDLKLNLTHMIDGYSGHEHTLPIHPLYKDVVQFVVQTKTFYTPTMLVAYGAPWIENHFYQTTDVHGNMKLRRFVPHPVIDGVSRRRPQWFAEEEYDMKAMAKVVADIVHAGGRAGLGSHGQLQGLGAHWELWAMASGGLTPLEALKVATIFGAEAIGFQKDLGSLEAGKLADLIVLDQDPLKDLRNTNTIRFVMKNGELFEGNTLDQIWPKQKKLELKWMGGGDPIEGTAAPLRQPGK